MVGHSQIVLDLIPAVGQQSGGGILLALDGALLQSGEDLGHGHGNRGSTQQLKVSHVVGNGGQTQLQALQVSQAVDGAHVVGHATVTVDAAAAQDVVRLNQSILEDLLDLGIVADCGSLFHAVEHPGEVGSIQSGITVSHQVAGHAALDGAQGHALVELGLGAQAVVAVQLHGVTAFRALIDHGLEDLFQSDAGGMGISIVSSNLQGNTLGLSGVASGRITGRAAGRAAAGSQRGHHANSQNQGQNSLLHFAFPPKKSNTLFKSPSPRRGLNLDLPHCFLREEQPDLAAPQYLAESGLSAIRNPFSMPRQ